MADEAAEQRPLPVSTPARRPEPHNANVATPLNTSEAAWTSSRCHRLLRSVTSRIAALRNLPESAKRPSQLQVYTTPAVVRPRPSELFNLGQAQSHGIRKASNDDPDWSPGLQPSKRVRRTYRSRGAIASRRPIQLPSSTLEQPQHTAVVDRVAVLREQLESSNSSDENPVQQPTKYQENRSFESLCKVAKSSHSSQWTVYVQLMKALESLLRVTKRQTRLPTGVDSLFHLCLKSVPAYIAEEQALVLDTDPESLDQVSSGVYADLEAWGSANGKEWRPLRVLVRSHAIAVLCDAINDATIPCRIAVELADLCIHNDALEECYQLCDAILSLVAPLSPPRTPSLVFLNKINHLELISVYKLSRKRGLWRYFFTKVAELLQDGTLPIQWLQCKDMDEIWNQAIIFSTHSAPHYKLAAEFLLIAMEKLCCHSSSGIKSLRHDPPTLEATYADRTEKGPDCYRTDPELILTSTLSNFLALLLSIAHLGTERNHWESIRDTITTWAVRLVAIQEKSSQPNQDSDPEMRSRRSLVLFACLLLPAIAPYDDFNLPPFIFKLVAEEWSASSEGLDCTVRCSELMRLTSMCCAAVKLELSWPCIQRMVSYVHNLHEQVAPNSNVKISAPLLQILRRSATLAAVEYAEATEVDEYLNWAYELEHLASETRGDDDLPPPLTFKGSLAIGEFEDLGFRWEGGIQEWIRNTPEVKRQQRMLQPAQTYPRPPLFLDGSSSPILSARQRKRISKTPDSPLSAGHKHATPHRPTLLDLTDTPAPTSQRYTVNHGLDGSSDLSETTHSFDLFAEWDDIDELSILTDRSNYQDAGKSPTRHSPRKSPLKPPVPRMQRAKGSSQPRRNHVVPRSSSFGHAGSKSTNLAIERRQTEKRRFDDRESIENGYSSSGDELAL